MLSFAEEIYLLALDDETGKLDMSNSRVVLDNALVGALLCELSFMGRLDSDVDHIYVLNTEPTGHKLLDKVLKKLADDDATIPIERCIGSLFFSAIPLEEMVRDQLVDRGILRVEEGRIMWVIPTRCYPVSNQQEILDVERRLCNLILSDDLPDPRDAVLVGLADICGLLNEILSPKELKRRQERIATLGRMDLVAQKVRTAITDIFVAQSQCSSPTGWDSMM